MPKWKDKKTIIKNVTEHIKTNEPQKILSGSEFTKKISSRLAARSKKPSMKILQKIGSKLGKRSLKALPGIGSLIGIASALKSGNVSAALPAGLESEDLGPKKGSIGAVIEDPSASKIERAEAVRKALKKRNK